VFWYRTRGFLPNQREATVKRACLKRVTPHSGRHGFATTVLRKEIDPKSGAWLGRWKSIRHFMETCAHAIQGTTLNEEIFDAEELTQPPKPNAKKARETGTS
jgi:hypothetical protein